MILIDIVDFLKYFQALAFILLKESTNIDVSLRLSSLLRKSLLTPLCHSRNLLGGSPMPLNQNGFPTKPFGNDTIGNLLS